MNKLILILSALVIIASAVIIIWSCASSPARPKRMHRAPVVESPRQIREKFTKKKVLAKDWTVTPATNAALPAVRKERPEKPVDDWQEYTPEEEKFVDAINDALSDEKFEEIVALAEEASKATNPTVRREMVDALRSFDEKVLPELMLFLSDDDDDVREEAHSAFEQAVLNMEEENDRASVIVIAMSTLRDEDTIRSLGEGLSGLDNELIKAALEEVMNGENPKGCAVAADLYEDLVTD